MSTAFDRAWAFLQRPDIEGGARVSRDPDDPGGTTKWGISQRAYPREDIANLTEARARELFRADYWQPCRCDEMPDSLAVAVADSAFNQGVGTAITLLQEAVRANPDGRMGPNTLAAVRAAWSAWEALAEGPRKWETDPVNEFLSRRALRYSDGKGKYRRGWFLRLFRLRVALSAV